MMTLTPAYEVAVIETIICKFSKRKVKRERISVLKSFSLQKNVVFFSHTLPSMHEHNTEDLP